MSAARVRSSAARPLAVAALVVYGVGLAFIAFWPQHVDRGAGRLIHFLTHVVPWLTYDRLEFGANVLLFVPFGVLGAALVRRMGIVVVPVAGLVVSAIIETVQTFLLPGRTGSILDVVANTAGATLGTILMTVLLAAGLSARRAGVRAGGVAPAGRPR